MYSVSESTTGSIMCIEQDLLLFIVRKSSCSSSSHAYEHSLATKKETVMVSSPTYKNRLSQLLAQWLHHGEGGWPSVDSENVIETKGQSPLRTKEKPHQPGRFVSKASASQHQCWTVVITSRHLSGSPRQSTMFMSEQLTLCVTLINIQYFGIHYFTWDPCGPVRFGKSVMIFPIFR